MHRVSRCVSTAPFVCVCSSLCPQLLNWISYGATPHEVLFPAALFPPHAPGATLPRAEWWHHMLSVFAPLNFPAAICVERDGRDELGFNVRPFIAVTCVCVCANTRSLVCKLCVCE